MTKWKKGSGCQPLLHFRTEIHIIEEFRRPGLPSVLQLSAQPHGSYLEDRKVAPNNLFQITHLLGVQGTFFHCIPAVVTEEKGVIFTGKLRKRRNLNGMQSPMGMGAQFTFSP